MSAHLFIGGSRHGKPSEGYDTPTMRVHVEGQRRAPYLIETYKQTGVRLDLGEPVIVYALEGMDAILVWGQFPLTSDDVVRHVAEDLVARNAARYREHFRFMRTGEGRPFGRD